LIWDDLRYFEKYEFICKCGCGRADMEYEFLKKLDGARHTAGFPFPINSGYRCPEHNNAVSGTGLDGPHTTGKAADLGLSYNGARKALTILSETFSGIGLKQKGDSRFIHVDDLEPRIWTY